MCIPVINLIEGLTVYEVVFATYDEDGNYEECIENSTIISPYPMTPQDIIKEAIVQEGIDHKDRLVQIFEARSATINYYKGDIELVDCDTSTGYSGSPIYEIHYDCDGNKVTHS